MDVEQVLYRDFRAAQLDADRHFHFPEVGDGTTGGGPGGGVEVGELGGHLAHGGDNNKQALLGLTCEQRYGKRLEPRPRSEQDVGAGPLHVADVVRPAGRTERRSSARQCCGDSTFSGYLRPCWQRQRYFAARPEGADERRAPGLCTFGQGFAAEVQNPFGVLGPQVEAFSGLGNEAERAREQGRCLSRSGPHNGQVGVDAQNSDPFLAVGPMTAKAFWAPRRPARPDRYGTWPT